MSEKCIMIGARMKISGSLSGDSGIKNLDAITDIAISDSNNLEQALDELTSFYVPKLSEGSLPFTDDYEYPSPIQKQVYAWISVRYFKLVEFLNSNQIQWTDSIASSIAQLLCSDKQHSLAKAAASAYVQRDFYSEDAEILKISEFQDAVYSFVKEGLPNNLPLALHILTTPFDSKETNSSEFAELFSAVISIEMAPEDHAQLLKGFAGVLQRMNKLSIYDYLLAQFKGPSSLAALALPHIITVSLDSAIDLSTFDALAFKAISPSSLSNKGRASFLNSLSRMLCHKSIPNPVVIAFAVKLSRMLPLIPIDAQMDVISLLHEMIRTHECVAALVEPKEGQAVSKVDGEISECEAQTLWELRAMYNHPVPMIADMARSCGQRRVPEPFESFNLREIIKPIKAAPQESTKTGNWIRGLDRSIWSMK